MTNLIEQFVEKFTDSRTVMEQIRKQAELEGIPKEVLRQLLETALKKRGLKVRRIYELLPEELKQPQKQHFKAKSAALPAADDSKKVPEEKKTAHEILREKISESDFTGGVLNPVMFPPEIPRGVNVEHTEHQPGEIELNLVRYGKALGDSTRNGRKTARLKHDGSHVLDITY